MTKYWRDAQIYWRDSATCRQVDPELFFPKRGESAGPLKAKKICSACPVKTECLEDSLRTGERSGIWGGLTSDERKLLSQL